MRVWHVHGVGHGAVQTLVNGTVNSVAAGSVSGLVHSPVEVQVPFHRLSTGSFQPLATKLSFTGQLEPGCVSERGFRFSQNETLEVSGCPN